MSANQNANAAFTPGTDNRPAKRAEHARDLTQAFLLALEKVDRKLADSVRSPLLSHLARWEMEPREDSR